MVILGLRQSLLSIERLEYHKHGSRKKTWAAIAAKLKVIPSTIENIVKQRVKSIDAELAVKIRNLHLSTIEAERAQLENDFARIVRINPAVDPNEMGEVEALLESARNRLRDLGQKG